jgi:purine-binding chemotaxis protein CheW
MNINELTQMVNRVTAATAGDGADTAVSDIETVQIVSFLLDDVEYGINILRVHEIIRMPEITRLPNTPEYIKGVINLRGSVIPVVDVRIRFGLPQGNITDLTRVIVVETGEKLVGLLVDSVYQVIRMPGRNIDPPADLIEGISDEFINGIGRVSGRLVVILNLDNILFSRSNEEKTAYGYGYM